MSLPTQQTLKLIPAPEQTSGSVAITGGVVTGLSKLAGRDTSAAYDVVLAFTSSTPATTERIITVDSQNQDWTLRPVAQANKGDLLLGAGAGAVAVLAAGDDQTLIEVDSTQPTGYAHVTPATLQDRRNALYAASPGAIDLAHGINQRMTLASGVNALTAFSNPKSGTTYVFELIQPASGAAGTITLAATAPDTIKGTYLTLSPTNGKINLLFMFYDGTQAGAGYFLASVSGEF